MTRRVPAEVTRRRTLRGAILLGLTSGAVVGIAAEGYALAYPDAADRTVVASSIGSNPGLAALFGQPRALETIAGFTEWRVLGVMPLVAGVWAVLAGTGALRGEEDAGRWDVVLAGPVGRREATAAAVLGLAQTAGALALATALSTVAFGIRTLGLAGSLGTVGALLVVPLVFLAVAAVASQIGGTRAQALRLAAAVLGVAYLLRVVATAVDGWDALAWGTPLGWVDLAAPLTEPTAVPLLVAVVATVVLAGVAVETSARRDVGAGLWPERPPRRSRTSLLTGPTGLSVRLAQPAAVAWMAGMAVLGGVLGTVARTASEALQDSLLDDGLGGSLADVELAGGTTSFLGASFLVVALLLSLLAAGQAAAARDEEASGRLDTLLSAPVGRVAWLGGRLVVAGVLLAFAATSAALAAWAGTAATGGETTAADLLAAAATVVPAALVVLGLGMLVLCVAPRHTAPLAYGYVAAAFLLEILGSVLDLPEPVLALSVFHHLPLVPAADPEPVTAAVMLLVALALSAVGAVALRHRDLTGA